MVRLEKYCKILQYLTFPQFYRENICFFSLLHFYMCYLLLAFIFCFIDFPLLFYVNMFF
jgi:hypothetical protein